MILVRCILNCVVRVSRRAGHGRWSWELETNCRQVGIGLFDKNIALRGSVADADHGADVISNLCQICHSEEIQWFYMGLHVLCVVLPSLGLFVIHLWTFHLKNHNFSYFFHVFSHMTSLHPWTIRKLFLASVWHALKALEPWSSNFHLNIAALHCKYYCKDVNCPAFS